MEATPILYFYSNIFAFWQYPKARTNHNLMIANKSLKKR